MLFELQIQFELTTCVEKYDFAHRNLSIYDDSILLNSMFAICSRIIYILYFHKGESPK